jgi:hypothetical protein
MEGWQNHPADHAETAKFPSSTHCQSFLIHHAKILRKVHKPKIGISKQFQSFPNVFLDAESRP